MTKMTIACSQLMFSTSDNAKKYRGERKNAKGIRSSLIVVVETNGMD